MNVQPTHEQVDQLFERYTRPGSPGCALAVMKDGAILYQQGYGLADLEKNVPILPSTVFNIGSMAKQFTAFAIALLQAEGRLSLDADFRQYLPEMSGLGRTITLHHLIHHTSGIRCTFPELLALAGWRDTDTTTTDDVFRILQAQRELNFDPGEEYLYANSNYILLARICERVSGQPFAAFCQERIFGPLGMTHSVINDSILKIIPGRAPSYCDDERGGWANVPLVDSVVGPTNVYTTVEDLAHWDENLYSGRVGGAEVVALMHQPGHLNDGTEVDYAFGLEVGADRRHRGWQLVEHGGGQGGYVSWMVRFPELRLGVVVLFNCFLWGARDMALQVADVFLPERAPHAAGAEADLPAVLAAAVPLSPEQLQSKVGTYFDERRAVVREVTCQDGRLLYDGYDLTPLAEDRFLFTAEPDVQVVFLPAAQGRPAAIKTITASGQYHYGRVKRISLTADGLAEYAGHYYSPELDVHWTLAAAEDHLVARRHKYVDSRLRPLFRDTFGDDWLPIMGYPTTYTVRFERDAHGAVCGLRVWGSRVRGLRLVRQG